MTRFATLAGPVRCHSYAEKTTGRLQTICDDGTRGMSTYNRTLERWETTITPPYHRDKVGPPPKAPRR